MRGFPSQQEVLKLFECDPQRTFRLRELVFELGLRSSQARELKSVLKDLSRSKKPVYLNKTITRWCTRSATLQQTRLDAASLVDT
jgi:sugar diacid utilization regulator